MAQLPPHLTLLHRHLKSVSLQAAAAALTWVDARPHASEHMSVTLPQSQGCGFARTCTRSLLTCLCFVKCSKGRSLS